MTEWVLVDTETVTKPAPREIHGVTVEVVLSPYEIPDAFRGYYDNERDRFIIEFRYPDPEDWRLQSDNKNIGVRVGQHSGRIYGFEVNAKGLGADTVNLVLRALSDASQKPEATQHLLSLAQQALATKARSRGTAEPPA
jgi:hypothetical protein